MAPSYNSFMICPEFNNRMPFFPFIWGLFPEVGVCRVRSTRTPQFPLFLPSPETGEPACQRSVGFDALAGRGLGVT